jgi:serine acetyltransferase
MKTSPLDYLVAIPCILLNLAAAVICTWFLAPLTRQLTGSYHVVVDLFLGLLFFLLATGVSVRLLLMIHPLSPGQYSMESREFFVWKLYTSIHEMGGMAFLPFVPIFLRPAFFAFFGAKMGKNVAIGGRLIEPYLVSVGDNAFFGGDSMITAHAVTPGKLTLRPVVIGEHAFIGGRATIEPGCKVGHHAIVASSALLREGTEVAPYEIWGGVPAKKIGEVERQST